eukprot:scaffold15769_cov135-Skeletonema_menzelii.AAC.4
MVTTVTSSNFIEENEDEAKESGPKKGQSLLAVGHDDRRPATRLSLIVRKLDVLSAHPAQYPALGSLRRNS